MTPLACGSWLNGLWLRFMLLRTENLTKDYGRLRALDNLNLEIGAGEVFGLLGPNGAGKSTALRLLLGFLRPTSGRASIAGHDCWREGVAARRQVAYLPGELRLYENMSGQQLISFLTKLRAVPNRRELGELARAFDINLARPIAALSSGMKRKLALLQVFLPHAPLLIMDEPTNTLDPTMRDELLDHIRHARTRGQAVLFSSHVLGEVEKVCDRVGILQGGKLVQVQDMAELRSVRLVRASFSGVVGPVPELPGLRHHERHHQQLVFEHAGPLAPLLEWLACQPVADLQIEPLGLAAIYQRYHGTSKA